MTDNVLIVIEDEDEESTSDGEEETMEPDNEEEEDLPTLLLLQRPGDERWIQRQRLSEQEMPWNHHIRMSSAVSDALLSNSTPILFELHRSVKTTTCRQCPRTLYCAWWPSMQHEALGRDVLKTLWVTLDCVERYWGGDGDNVSSLQPLLHRSLIRALVQVTAHATPLGGAMEFDGDREEAESLLREYFGPDLSPGCPELGRLRHVYFYEHEKHWGDSSVYIGALDIKLATFHWQC